MGYYGQISKIYFLGLEISICDFFFKNLKLVKCYTEKQTGPHGPKIFIQNYNFLKNIFD